MVEVGSGAGLCRWWRLGCGIWICLNECHITDRVCGMFRGREADRSGEDKPTYHS